MKHFFILLASFLSVQAIAQDLHIQAPNGQINLNVHVKNGSATYDLSYKNKTVLEPSQLGFQLQEQGLLQNNWSLVKVDSAEVNDSWEPVWGEQKSIKNHYKELAVLLKQNSANPISLRIVFRVFNDGIGFRYEFPEQEFLQHFVVSDELTSFNFTNNHKVWWIPGDFDTNEYAYFTLPM